MNLLLCAPEYRPNLSNMIRSAEFFGLEKIYIYDKNHLLDPPSNKTSRAEMNHMARVWTAGAIEFIRIIKIDEIHSFLKSYEGRKLATVIDGTAHSLYNFRFLPNDLIIMGSEKNGLSREIISLCNESINLPHKGNTDCLNVAVSLGTFLYAYNSQLQ